MSIVVATLLLSSPSSPELKVEIVSQHGAFVIEREDYHARMPIMHMPNDWKKARMIWSSHDGAVRAVYEDDGGFLNFGYEIRREIGGEIACYVGGSYAAYSASSPRPEAWRGGVKGLRKALADCGGINVERRLAYEREFELAADDYVPASAALRVLSRTLFDSLVRCIAKRVINTQPFPTTECLRRAGPKK